MYWHCTEVFYLVHGLHTSLKTTESFSGCSGFIEIGFVLQLLCEVAMHKKTLSSGHMGYSS